MVASSAAPASRGSLSLAAARRGRRRAVSSASSPTEAEAATLRASGLADEVVVADARDPVGLADGGPRALAARPT